MKKLIIFTDLDETLLERRTYSFAKAKPALKLIKEKDIPLIIATSKTLAEIEYCRKKLANRHPFISENGGGIFIPEGYFKNFLTYEPEKSEGYESLTLGTPYERLREALAKICSKGFNVKGFGDMTPEEIMELTGLTREEAQLAQRRHFDEPFVCAECDLDALKKAIRSKGLRFMEGRLFHITGENDKGKAVEILKDLFRTKFGDIVTAALGDSPSDMPMLKRVDYPVVVQKDDGSYHPGVDVPGIIRADGIGPDGWNKAVLEVIRLLGS